MKPTRWQAHLWVEIVLREASEDPYCLRPDSPYPLCPEAEHYVQEICQHFPAFAGALKAYRQHDNYFTHQRIHEALRDVLEALPKPYGHFGLANAYDQLEAADPWRQAVEYLARGFVPKEGVAAWCRDVLESGGLNKDEIMQRKSKVMPSEILTMLSLPLEIESGGTERITTLKIPGLHSPFVVLEVTVTFPSSLGIERIMWALEHATLRVEVDGTVEVDRRIRHLPTTGGGLFRDGESQTDTMRLKRPFRFSDNKPAVVTLETDKPTTCSVKVIISFGGYMVTNS